MKRTNGRLPLAAVLIAALLFAVAPPSGARSVVEGKLEIVHVDDFKGGTSHHDYFLDTGQEVLELEFAEPPPEEQSGATVRVTGERRGKKMQVESYQVAAAPGGKGGGGGGKPPKGPAPILGPRKTLVILFNFTDNPTQPTLPEDMRSRVFGATSPSSATYFKEVSFDKTSIVGKYDAARGDVAGWFTIADQSAPCDYVDWGTKARAAAQAAGFDLTGYNHIIHYFPTTAACEWNGLASIGGSHSWINGTTSVGTITHELGHNVGLHHANAYNCTTGQMSVALGGSCTSREYGDPFDVMGTSSGLRHFNSFNKGRLGWTASANTQTVTASGTYTVVPVETASAAGVQALRISRGNGTYLYVEYRQPHGYDNFVATDPVVNGGSIRIAGAYDRADRTQLIDTVPSTPTFTDAPLLAGRGVVDPVGRIQVETVSAAPDALRVAVKVAYTDVAPSVVAGDAHIFPRLVPHAHEGASASDADSNLMSYQWSFASCPSVCPPLTRDTGQLSGGGGPVPGPIYTAAETGTYRLNLTVWDTAGRSTTATIEETAI